MENSVNYKRKTIINFLSLPIGVIVIFALLFLLELRGDVIAGMGYLLYGIPFTIVYFIFWNIKVIDDLITLKKIINLFVLM